MLSYGTNTCSPTTWRICSQDSNENSGLPCWARTGQRLWMKKKKKSRGKRKLTGSIGKCLMSHGGSRGSGCCSMGGAGCRASGRAQSPQSASCGHRGRHELEPRERVTLGCVPGRPQLCGRRETHAGPLLLLTAGRLQPPAVGTQPACTAPTTGRACKDNRWSHHAIHLGKRLGFNQRRLKCSCIWLFATPWTVVCQAPLSLEFSGQGYWSGKKKRNTGVDCHSFLQGAFPTQGSNPGLLHYRQILYHLSHQGSLMVERPINKCEEKDSEQKSNEGEEGKDGDKDRRRLHAIHNGNNLCWWPRWKKLSPAWISNSGKLRTQVQNNAKTAVKQNQLVQNNEKLQRGITQKEGIF